MGQTRDFSIMKEASLLSCIALHELPLSSQAVKMYPGVTEYQKDLIDYNRLTASKVQEIFNNVRAIEKTYTDRFLEKKGDVDFHNTLVKTLYNNIIDRDTVFDAQALIAAACETYVETECLRLYTPDGEIDWDYVSALQHSGITQEWPELADARAAVLSVFLFSLTTVDELGNVTTNYEALEQFINNGYESSTTIEQVFGTSVYVSRNECSVEDVAYYLRTTYELSPVTLRAIAMYEEYAFTNIIGPNSYLAFSGANDDIGKKIVLAEIEKCDLLSLIGDHSRYTVDGPRSTNRRALEEQLYGPPDLFGCYRSLCRSHEEILLGTAPKISIRPSPFSAGLIHLDISPPRTDSVASHLITESYTIRPFDVDISQESLRSHLAALSADISSGLNTLKQDSPSSAWLWTDTLVSAGLTAVPIPVVPGVVGTGYTSIRGYTELLNNRTNVETLNRNIDDFLSRWTEQLQEIGDESDVTAAYALGGRTATDIHGNNTVISVYCNTTELEIRARAYGSTGLDLLEADGGERDRYVRYYSSETGRGKIETYRRELEDIFTAYKSDTGKLTEISSVNYLSPAQIAELDKKRNDPDYLPDLVNAP